MTTNLFRGLRNALLPSLMMWGLIFWLWFAVIEQWLKQAGAWNQW